jgi:hypothetical protein
MYAEVSLQSQDIHAQGTPLMFVLGKPGEVNKADEVHPLCWFRPR